MRGTGTDILFVSWNRLAFTQFAFDMLVDNTDWSLVDRLVIWDDYSSDGTLDWLRENADRADAEVLVRVGGYRSCVAIMNRYVATFGEHAQRFAKIDNDIAVPPGWLNDLVAVMDASPELELLGMEAGFTQTRGPEPAQGGSGPHTWEPARHIGGVGLFRTSAFLKRPPLRARGRFGFTHWQEFHEPVLGWITPDLAAAQLDRVPFEPWRSLSIDYMRLGWQREWSPHPSNAGYWDWWPEYARERAA